ncbi:MAG: DUF2807 domain-containing protein [Chitinophagaceae bacterium]|jgi:hypothetical protein|nr:DUF2807 domain-containing protein [Chitinophagaceae bacterium]
MARTTFTLTIMASILIHGLLFAQHSSLVDPFDKVIVSPYIQVDFVEGPQEMVTIGHCAVDPSKLFVEVNGRTLRIYLEGAKETPKWHSNSGNDYSEKDPIYQGTVVKATIVYKNLREVSLRGDEDQLFKGLLKAQDFRLKVYGNSDVIFERVEIEDYHASLYGENYLLIKSGKIASQNFTVYGVSTIDSRDMVCSNSKLTTYGEAEYYVHAEDEIRFSLFGEASLFYKGNPVIYKKLNVGDMRIARLN